MLLSTQVFVKSRVNTSFFGEVLTTRYNSGWKCLFAPFLKSSKEEFSSPDAFWILYFLILTEQVNIQCVTSEAIFEIWGKNYYHALFFNTVICSPSRSVWHLSLNHVGSQQGINCKNFKWRKIESNNSPYKDKDILPVWRQWIWK